jgi:HAD superfamily hydrolase (TIGR01484 family)
VQSKGWICLDIDGTITSDPHAIPQQVLDYLESLYKEGWHFLFTTGRTFTFGQKILSTVAFPYLFSVQNGADVLQMPEKKLVHRSYLPADATEQLHRIYQGAPEDYIVYSGCDLGDFCYYSSFHFSVSMKEHLSILMSLVNEPWKDIDSLLALQGERFPLIKCLGTKEQMQYVCNRVLTDTDFNVSIIKDPLSKTGGYNALITSNSASKGAVIAWLRSKEETDLIFIGAGDDGNDLSLLEQVDVSIAMETGPEELRAYADIIAPSATNLGIIQGLQQAIQMQGC